MTYVVLARKWRPQRFEDLTGQEHVARTLQNAISSGRIPHAVLFTGPRGVGKTSSARILSMALNCEHGPTPTPCGQCQACLDVQTGRSVDILEIDGASNRGINEIRELRDSVQYAPSRGRFKVYIIDEVHMLTTEAFNALLKTLEEPPPHVIFIFATTEPQKIPVTILSRCQRFDFRQIGLKDMMARLQEILTAEKIEAEPDALRLVARQADGGMRDALSLLDQVISSSDGTITAEQTAEFLGATDRRLLFAMSDAVLQRDAAMALQVFHRALSRGTDVRWLASEFASHLRDLTILAVAGHDGSLTILSEDEVEQAQQQLAITDAATLEALLATMITAAEEIATSSMATLRYELALIRMCEMASTQRLDDLIALLEAHAGIAHALPSKAARPQVSNAPSSASRESIPVRVPTPDVHKATTEAPTVEDIKKPQTTQAPTVEDAKKPQAAEATTVDDVKKPQTTQAAADESGRTAHLVARTSAVPHAENETSVEVQAQPASFHDDSAQDEAQEEASFSQIEDALSDPTMPAVEQAAPVVVEPTAELWREMVSMLRGPMAFWGRMLAMGYCIAEDGVFRVGISSTYLQEREELQEVFRDISEQKLGRAWTIVLVEDTTLTPEDHTRAWRIRTEEQEEEEAHRVQIFKQLQEHPFIQRVKERWPDYELQREDIDFQPLRSDETNEDQGDL